LREEITDFYDKNLLLLKKYINKKSFKNPYKIYYYKNIPDILVKYNKVIYYYTILPNRLNTIFILIKYLFTNI
jgi:hypothetical protein